MSMNSVKAGIVLVMAIVGFDTSADFTCRSGEPACIQWGQGVYSDSDVNNLENDYRKLQRKFNNLADDYDDLLVKARRLEREQQSEYNELVNEFNELLEKARKIEKAYNACRLG